MLSNTFVIIRFCCHAFYTWDNAIFGVISRSLISRLDGLLRCIVWCENPCVTMLVYGHQYPGQPAVVGQPEATAWNIQCHEMNQNQIPDNRMCTHSGYNSNYPTNQCYNNDPNPYSVAAPYYPPQEVYNLGDVQVGYLRQPVIPNLPCQQSQQWDYSSMCYNVDGQPCQYTNVVDLEDFMWVLFVYWRIMYGLTLVVDAVMKYTGLRLCCY